MSGGFDSKKDSQSTNFERSPQIFVKLSFRVMLFKVIWLTSLWYDTTLWSNFCDSHWELPGRLEKSLPPEIAVAMHFHVRTCHLNYPGIFTCWWRNLLVATSKFGALLSGSTVQPENTYSCILKVTSQVWESQKKNQHESQLPPTFIHLSHSQLIYQ